MVTKELARAFCDHWNGARPGETIYLNADGSVGDHPCNPWAEVVRDNSPSLDAAEAFARLMAYQSEAVRRLNAAIQRKEHSSA